MTVVIAEKEFNDKRNAAFSCNMTVNICCIRIVESNGRNIYNLAYILQTACRPKKYWLNYELYFLKEQDFKL